MGAFTDLFIRRPVLSIVVSLLILLVGAQAGFNLQIRQYPALVRRRRSPSPRPIPAPTPT